MLERVLLGDYIYGDAEVHEMLQFLYLATVATPGDY